MINKNNFKELLIKLDFSFKGDTLLKNFTPRELQHENKF